MYITAGCNTRADEALVNTIPGTAYTDSEVGQSTPASLFLVLHPHPFNRHFVFLPLQWSTGMLMQNTSGALGVAAFLPDHS